MRLVPEREHFRVSLAGWAIRGALCALPSFLWAVVAGLARPRQLSAMLLGLATWVVGCAWIAAQPEVRTRAMPGTFGWAMGNAAWIRALLAPVMFAGPDLFLGLKAMQFAEWIFRWFGGLASGRESEFVTVLAVTLVQGALVAASIVGLVFVWYLGRIALRSGNAVIRLGRFLVT